MGLVPKHENGMEFVVHFKDNCCNYFVRVTLDVESFDLIIHLKQLVNEWLD